ncbi:UDP-N-acetylmuramoyl-tripeptide--D-alanyl-D-alanine ligase [Porticoccus sp. W117]|uniref:UDP-N-acetylmuramoyl-tripeptide--D-alanyl-D- alanine ligase n=1 Tax=Porticoccus sp. W117 TaxID=3054777 RepID=UPI00259684FD|nr:UDP-N-acetylmuramoyl-tripeptide--D-alanyl-D-alanine ligase [Porticoccus sp. W117]MDM3871750.1 UDP-N-acetylmuramoyl-tripeptide--D-alanyl-D-alanine ligase [Porticoccus sp. W117]
MSTEMPALSLSRAAIEYGGTLMHPDCHFDGLSTDTRNIASGQLFVALRGENFDAHNFLAQAAEKACGLVVEAPDRSLEIPQWVVPDTTVALGQVAHLKRRDFEGSVVAVTGSAGKTTVKEMLAAIFAQAVGESAVLATKGNLNNHIGVPLTLMNLQHQHRYGVIEMGASGGGEIGYLCQLARPQVALVNNVLPAHVEGFGSVDAIADAKGEIYSGLPVDGTAVLNLDEVYVDRWRGLIGERSCLTFSVENAAADIFASDIRADELGRCSFTLHSPQGEVGVNLTISGRHNVANALAAAGVALAAGVEVAHIGAGLSALQSVPGRMELLELTSGDYLIDDSYNANPGSVKAAVDALLQLPGIPVLVLGDMGELGDDEVALHAEVGEYAAQAGVAQLMTVGTLSANTSAAFGEGGQHFDNQQDLLAALVPQLGAGMAVLVKGSRSSGMENITKALVAASAGEQ